MVGRDGKAEIFVIAAEGDNTAFGDFAIGTGIIVNITGVVFYGVDYRLDRGVVYNEG